MINGTESDIPTLYFAALEQLASSPLEQLRLAISARDPEIAHEAPAYLVLRTSEQHAARSFEGGVLKPSFDYGGTIDGTIVDRVFSHYQSLLLDGDGLSRVVGLLQARPFSKRLLLDVWPNPPGVVSGDDPCLMYLWVRMTDRGLILHAHFRGNDAYNKLLLNLDIMAQVHQYLADSISIPACEYRHFSDSLHIYAADIARVDRLLRNRDLVRPAA